MRQITSYDIICFLVSIPIIVASYMLYRYLPLYWNNIGLLIGYIGFIIQFQIYK